MYLWISNYGSIFHAQSNNTILHMINISIFCIYFVKFKNVWLFEKWDVHLFVKRDSTLLEMRTKTKTRACTGVGCAEASAWVDEKHLEILWMKRVGGWVDERASLSCNLSLVFCWLTGLQVYCALLAIAVHQSIHIFQDFFNPNQAKICWMEGISNNYEVFYVFKKLK